MTASPVDLSMFSSQAFDRGRSRAVELLWRVVSALVFQCPLVPFYGLKRGLLRRFGARIGRGVLIKPRVTITFPWRLRIDDYAWIGEGVWLDSLAEIRIGSNACLSQGSYLCTGNHDFRARAFTLLTAPIQICEGAWIAARCAVGPGVTVGAGAIATLGSVVFEDLEAGGIYRGNPAVRVGTR